jgi:hypothetical protein
MRVARPPEVVQTVASVGKTPVMPVGLAKGQAAGVPSALIGSQKDIVGLGVVHCPLPSGPEGQGFLQYVQGDQHRVALVSMHAACCVACSGVAPCGRWVRLPLLALGWGMQLALRVCKVHV